MCLHCSLIKCSTLCDNVCKNTNKTTAMNELEFSRMIKQWETVGFFNRSLSSFQIDSILLFGLECDNVSLSELIKAIAHDKSGVFSFYRYLINMIFYIIKYFFLRIVLKVNNLCFIRIDLFIVNFYNTTIIFLIF